MKSFKYIFIALSYISLGFFYSCTGDLDTIPVDPDLNTSEVVYDDPNSYIGVLAKLYAGLAVSGQQGPAGQSDIEGIDEGFGQYLRALWYHQELPTDEALIGWNDQTIADFHDQDWTAQDGFIFAWYSRVFYQIPLANEFIRETTDEKLDERGVETSLRNDIEIYRAEARFLRALSYWHALDHFRNVPFVTEEDAVGSFFPNQTNAQDLFNYIESELLAIEGTLIDARQNEYGRADKAAAWALLAKLYLNAEVYIGQARYTECLDVCNKIINAGYSLEPVYQNLFLADNHNSNEIIFPIAFDGINTRTWGGMTFIIRAAIGGSMNPTLSGVVSGWGGSRTTKQLVNKFGTLGGTIVAEQDSFINYAKIYAPGSYQGFDPELDNAEIRSRDNNNIFEGYKYFPQAGGSFHIKTIPSASAPKLGDNDGDGILDFQGADIPVSEAGLYRIVVDLENNSYEVTPIVWGIVGDAVGSWDDDIAMEWNDELEALQIEVSSSGGQFKFRANGSWDLNLGDTDGDGVLLYEDENINIPEGGYDITLFINRPDYYYSIRQSSFDTRGIFYSEGQNIEIEDVALFTDGYAVTKFKNIYSDGSAGSDTDFPDTDFPMFRLADVHLMAAEAIVRGGGSMQEAIDHVNAVRTRAFGSTGGNIQMSQLDLPFLLEERARELYWECHRRTDLVRFGQFTNGDYRWAWKGGVKEGQAVESFRDVYPIPASDLGANPNLVQNDGY